MKIYFPSMKINAFAVLVLLCSALTFGQTTNITGTVTNAAGAKIAGAKVSLSNLTATTNANGVYQLTGQAVPLLGNLKPSYFNLVNGEVLLQLSQEMDLDISLYDITGKLVAHPIKGKINKGNHQFSLKASLKNSGVLFLKLTHQQKTSIFKIASSTSLKSNLNINSNNLRKTQLSYNLVVTANGYEDRVQSINSLTGTFNVVLNPKLEKITIYYSDNSFELNPGLDSLKKAFEKKGVKASSTSENLVDSLLKDPDSKDPYVLYSNGWLMALSYEELSGKTLPTLKSGEYVIRVLVKGATRGIWVLGSDSEGANNGAYRLSQLLATTSIWDIQDQP